VIFSSLVVSIFQVQILVENNKRLDLRNALRLIADVQPIEIDDSVIDDVSMYLHRSYYFNMDQENTEFINLFCE
jgi:hypothetical protein